MFASINSRDSDKESSPGKTMDVSTTFFTVAAGTAGSGPNRYLEIKANNWESYGSGARGGDVKTVERTLTLRLTEADLRTVIEQAVAAGMFPAPGMTELLAAHASLSECLRRLNLTPAGASATSAAVSVPSGSCD